MPWIMHDLKTKTRKHVANVGEIFLPRDRVGQQLSDETESFFKSRGEMQVVKASFDDETQMQQ